MVLGDVLGLAAPCEPHAVSTGAATSTAASSARAISRRVRAEMSTRPPRPVPATPAGADVGSRSRLAAVIRRYIVRRWRRAFPFCGTAG